MASLPAKNGERAKRPSATSVRFGRQTEPAMGLEVSFGELRQHRPRYTLQVDVAAVAEALEALGHVGQAGA
ncbi:hypothetical protein MAALD49_10030 [Marinobacter shengliensis]|uniref:Uncharacterized protein n=1 Tax=Marinobacter nauticus TaxID=2743 RepID=A0A455W2E1_MARNT|nr:hypothetical protein YBY_08980 [Marinobacter nauticus]BEH13635.1 hypothetical protein MAALD49_10030 [Marinobacter shengliensis]